MPNPFRAWFGPKNTQPKEQERSCNHDWEVVERCNWMWRVGDEPMSMWFLLEEILPWSIDMPFNMATRKVCLKCGACRDEIAEASDCIHRGWDFEKKHQHDRKIRKNLAQKMWSNCKGDM